MRTPVHSGSTRAACARYNMAAGRPVVAVNQATRHSRCKATDYFVNYFVGCRVGVLAGPAVE
jgi:hypothetical protein